jgi:hypothetical protein
MSKKWKTFGIAGLVIAFVAFQFINWKPDTVSAPSVRTPASTPEFKRSANVEQINQMIKSIKTSSDVSKVAQEILNRDKAVNADKKIKDDGLRLYAIGASLVPYLEGSAYRLRHIAEKNMALFIPAITSLRRMKYAATFAPKHFDAAFDYLTKVNPDQDILGQKGPFQDITALQVYAVTKLAPIVTNAITDLEALIKSGDEKRIVYVTDLSLLIGDADAAKAREEHQDSDSSIDKIVLAGHLKGTVAIARENLAIAYYAASFNLEGAPELADKFLTQSYKSSKGRGLTNWFGDLSAGNNIPSPKESKAMILDVKKKYPKFLTANASAADNLNKSWNNFFLSSKAGQEYHQFIFEIAGTLSSPDSYIVNADSMKVHEHETMELVNKRVEIFSTKAPVTIKSPTLRTSQATFMVI